ncbi:MAG: crossover junction endodeoxyribonuclease RuvC [Parachlamydiales bacterium]
MKTQTITINEKNTSSIKKKRICGIDPGTAITGYGIIDCEGRSPLAVDYGCIRIPATIPLPDRYLALFVNLGELLDSFMPDEVALETQYVSKVNPQSALKVGMARGVAIIAARTRNIPIFEYAPTVAKRAVTGHGNASKMQVQGMVQRLLRLAKLPTPFDAADALSIALCHNNQTKLRL